MPFDREASAGYLANHMARLFARHLEARLKPHGLALGAFPALLHLWEQDGLTQRDLVERLGIEQPTMAATLTRMERDGLITRHRDEGDGRMQRVRLTERARGLRDAAVTEAGDVNAVATRMLTAEEKQQFITLLRKVIEALEQDR
ncbi:MarR family transcriptional regulator (plasmid) [Cereibacter azotoformans]|uniref:MarR family winged helix-turn-helix transcriptional regulator n=1 Tax=Cereibacter azotoformans TaxID=43057 RepID=UPI000E35C586|nr:MarR family transcriptional regulator [Cereibacter azotoformans]AXQ96336.1 MarR family transcriptional regulator [Cereibacter sphaeroides]UIJ33254.1 MarR family transcriptional regulator [Cereibacter azotoformans]UIJ33318.1 MarR family transcriptional regulator [Cereibacter azotoformans]